MSSEERPIPNAKAVSSPIKPSEATILKAITDGKTPTLAVKEAGFNMTRRNAENYVEHVKNKYADAQGGLLAALENVGVTLDTVASAIKDGLQANRTAKAGDKLVHLPDHPTRHKFLETTLDVMGARAPKQHVAEIKSTHESTVTFVDGIRSNPEVLLRIRERLKQRQEAETIEVQAEVGEDE